MDDNCIPLITTTMRSIESPSATIDNCKTKACGSNSRCIDTNSSAYCSCRAGYYGNPKVGCIAEIGVKYIVIPFRLKLGATFSVELKNAQTEKFSKYKTTLERILESAFRSKLNYINGSAEIRKFRYLLGCFDKF